MIQLEGQTPLHFLFNYHYTDLGSYLISKGADDSICNHFGYSCYEGLRPANKEEALMLLRKHRAKVSKVSEKKKDEANEAKRGVVDGAAKGGEWFESP